MVAFSKICLSAVAAVGVFGAPAQHGPLVKFGELKHIPAQWSAAGKADHSAMMKASIGLKQSNIQGLQTKLLDISNPLSPNYGKWLSQKEIEAYTAPNPADTVAVKAWLASAGITDVSQPSNDWIEFTVPVSKMESLLNAKYEWFVNAETGRKLPATTEFSVPKNLHALIDVVTPTTALFDSINPHISNDGALAAAGTTVTPDYIKSVYNVDYNATGNQYVASTGLINVGASHSDFRSFGNEYVSGLKDFKDVSVNGGSNNGDGSTLEGNLDTQYVGGLASPLPSEYLATGPSGSDGNSFYDALLAIANYLNNNSNPPSVVSTSYGIEEAALSSSYLQRVCNEFAKAGSRGVSVFFSSGDYGVGGNGEQSCSNGYYPLFPASCPYITSIGGTSFESGQEVVADFSKYSNAQSPGGGYSQTFTAPDYNKAVTTAYAQSLDYSQSSRLNGNNRGYPDISLVSLLYQVNVGGTDKSVLGTSASSPATAALFGLLNDYRQSKGQSSLGFLNPLLYSAKVKPALHDITSGANQGCDSRGLPAKRGWDAASGLGSFDFAKLRQLI